MARWLSMPRRRAADGHQRADRDRYAPGGPPTLGGPSDDASRQLPPSARRAIGHQSSWREPRGDTAAAIVGPRRRPPAGRRMSCAVSRCPICQSERGSPRWAPSWRSQERIESEGHSQRAVTLRRPCFRQTGRCSGEVARGSRPGPGAAASRPWSARQGRRRAQQAQGADPLKGDDCGVPNVRLATMLTAANGYSLDPSDAPILPAVSVAAPPGG